LKMLKRLFDAAFSILKMLENEQMLIFEH
jgi:hypothetical protein